MKNDHPKNQGSLNNDNVNSEANTWFAMLDGKLIDIEDAVKLEDFRNKEYKCPGCNHKTIAVKSDNRQNHFRHYTIKGEKPPCSYYDETFSHKVAKDILCRTKKVKLPALYKYSYDGTEKVRLRKEELYSGCFAKKEKRIYYNLFGQLVIEPRKKKDKIALQPDVIFYDKDYKPVLLIEINVTHKCNDEKIAKLRELKINTIEITIPPGLSEKEIEYHLSNISTNTKWLFNNEEYECNYESYTRDNSERICGDFQLEARTFSKSIACEIIRVRNLIWRVREFNNTDEFNKPRERIEQIIKEHQEIKSGLKSSLLDIKRRVKKEIRETIRREEEEFRIYIRDLDSRYQAKRKKLEQLTAETEDSIRDLEERAERAEGIDNPRMQRIFDTKDRNIDKQIEHTEKQIEYTERCIREEYRISGRNKEARENLYEEFREVNRITSEANIRIQKIQQLFSIDNDTELLIQRCKDALGEKWIE